MDFDKRKIVDAVLKAMDVTEQGEDIVLAAEIAATISKIEKEDMSVEDIQDVVEMELMNSPRKEVAKKYIAYRNQRNLARKAKSREIFKEIIEAQATDVTRENANMNADTPAGMMMKFASESTKSFVDECLLSEEVKDAVKNGYIHIHDKDYYPTKSLTCVQHPLDKILKNGFFAGHGESRPAKRIETASILGCISMETVQNEMHGGQAIPAFDFYMAPFVRKTFHEEIDKISDMLGKDFSHLKDVSMPQRRWYNSLSSAMRKWFRSSDVTSVSYSPVSSWNLTTRSLIKYGDGWNHDTSFFFFPNLLGPGRILTFPSAKRCFVSLVCSVTMVKEMSVSNSAIGIRANSEMKPFGTLKRKSTFWSRIVSMRSRDAYPLSAMTMVRHDDFGNRFTIMRAASTSCSLGADCITQSRNVLLRMSYRAFRCSWLNPVSDLLFGGK